MLNKAAAGAACGGSCGMKIPHQMHQSIWEDIGQLTRKCLWKGNEREREKGRAHETEKRTPREITVP